MTGFREIDSETKRVNHLQQKVWWFLLLKIMLVINLLFFSTVGILFAIGGGQKEFLVTQEIDASRETIFELITQPDSLKKWVTGVSQIESIGKPGSATLGVRFKTTINDKESQTVFDIQNEVTNIQQGRELQLSMQCDLFDATNNFQLSFKNDDGLSSNTIVVAQTFQVRFKGLSRISAAFLDKQIRLKLESDLLKLKDLAEKQPTPSLP